MARRNNFLVISLLAMVVSLFVAILWIGGDPERAPQPAGPDSGDPVTQAGELEAGEDGTGQSTVDTGGRTAVDNVPTVAAAATRIVLGGRLVDAQGMAVRSVELRYTPDARFELFDLDGPPTPTEEGTLTATTDGEGRFEFAVDAGRSGTLRLDPDTMTLFGDEPPRRRTVAAYTANADLGEISTRPAIAIRGTVVGPDGAGIGGAAVEARPADSPFTEMIEVETDERGEFELRGLLPVEHRIHVTKPGFVPGVLAANLDGPADPLRIALDRGRSISGRVQDDAGDPIAGARVSPYRAREIMPGIPMTSFDGAEAVTTSADGRFVLSGITDANVTLRVWADGYAARDQRDVAVPSDVTIVLPRCGVISGRLLDSEDQPIPGSRVRATAPPSPGIGGSNLMIAMPGRDVVATTDDRGQFTLENVTPGSVTLSAQGDDHLPVEHPPVQLVAGGSVDGVTLRAELGSSVAVTVMAPSGTPVGGATVDVRRPDGRAARGGRARSLRIRAGSGGSQASILNADGLAKAETGSDGKARIGGLPQGTLVLAVEHPDFASPKPVEVVLPRRGTQEALLTMLPAGFVALTSQDANGEALASAHWILRGPMGDSPKEQSGQTDAAGFARLGPLTAGNYQVALALPARPLDLGGGAPAILMPDSHGDELMSTRRDIAVVAEQTLDVELRRPVLTRLTGTVSDASGFAKGIDLSLRSVGDAEENSPLGGNGAWRAKSNAEGAFEFESLPPGRYELEFGKPGQLIPAVESFEILQGTPEIQRDLLLVGGEVRVTVLTEASADPIERAEVRLERVSSDGRTRRRQGVVMMRMATSDGGGGSAESLTIGGGGGRARTDEDGVATIEDVPPGRYRLVVEHRRHVTLEQADVEIPASGTTDLGSVKLRPGGVIRGTIEGQGDGAFRATLVEVRPVGGGESRRETTFGKTFRVDKLAPGAYEVRARRLGPDVPDEYGPWQPVDVQAGESSSVTVRLP